MILTKRCLVLSIRIQLQISTFLAITVELKSRKGSVWLHSLDLVMMKICDKLSREPFEVTGQEPPHCNGNQDLRTSLSLDIQWREKT